MIIRYDIDLRNKIIQKHIDYMETVLQKLKEIYSKKQYLEKENQDSTLIYKSNNLISESTEIIKRVTNLSQKQRHTYYIPQHIGEIQTEIQHLIQSIESQSHTRFEKPQKHISNKKESIHPTDKTATTFYNRKLTYSNQKANINNPKNLYIRDISFFQRQPLNFYHNTCFILSKPEKSIHKQQTETVSLSSPKTIQSFLIKKIVKIIDVTIENNNAAKVNLKDPKIVKQTIKYAKDTLFKPIDSKNYNTIFRILIGSIFPWQLLCMLLKA